MVKARVDESLIYGRVRKKSGGNGRPVDRIVVVGNQGSIRCAGRVNGEWTRI